MMSPVVDEIAQEKAGQLKVGKINVDDQPGLASQFGVMSIPTLILFKNGKAVQQSGGPEAQGRYPGYAVSVVKLSDLPGVGARRNFFRPPRRALLAPAAKAAAWFIRRLYIMKVVIIGGVAEALPPRQALRRLDESAEIVMLERSGYVSYANCGLPYYVGGTITEKRALTPANARELLGSLSHRRACAPRGGVH